MFGTKSRKIRELTKEINQHKMNYNTLQGKYSEQKEMTSHHLRDRDEAKKKQTEVECELENTKEVLEKVRVALSEASEKKVSYRNQVTVTETRLGDANERVGVLLEQLSEAEAKNNDLTNQLQSTIAAADKMENEYQTELLAYTETLEAKVARALTMSDLEVDIAEIAKSVKRHPETVKNWIRDREKNTTAE